MRQERVNKSQTTRLSHGFIVCIVDGVINLLSYVSAVEGLKWLARKLSDQKEAQETYEAVTVDLYIVSKWILILVFWVSGLSSRLFLIITVYLIFNNVYTYFYHHVWKDDASSPRQPDAANRRVKRLFVNALLAISFSTVAYGYLYNIAFKNDMSWPQENGSLTALYFSVGNTLTVTYGDVMPSTTAGRLLAVSQLIVTFIFVAIVLSKTIDGR
jgi:hypothetical protein